MPIPFEKFLNIRQAFGPSFTSDGARLAFLANITGFPQAWMIDSSGGWPDQLTFGTDRIDGVWCSPFNDQLVFARDVGGNENFQLFVMNTDGSGERRLTHDDGAMHIFGAWADAGKSIVFSANRRHRGRYDLYLQPLDSTEAVMIWQNELPGFLSPVAMSPDGKRLLVSFMYSATNQDLYEFCLEDRMVYYLTPHQGNVRFGLPAYTSDGRGVYCLCDAGQEYAGVVKIDLEDREIHFIAQPQAEVEILAVSNQGRYLAWGVNRDGAIDLTLFDLSTDQARPAPGLPVGVISPMDGVAPVFSPDDRFLAFGFSTSTHTIDVWVWDLEADRLAPVTHSSHAGIPHDLLVEPELIHFPTFDERRIPAWYYRAPGEPARKPVIVYVHGGPEAQTQPMLFPILQYFIHCGYSVLAPNVRGSSGYGKTYIHLDDVEKRMDSVADLAHAVEWLRQQPDVDASHIAVYGGSYGGFMVLAALTHYPDLWAAGVDIVGISNFVTFLENTGAYRRSHREAEYGSLAHDRAFLEKISPIHHVDRITAPLMIVHGANDPRVPLGEAEQIVAALRQRNVPVEFLVYSDEGHGLVKLANKLDAYPKIAAFLTRHLKT